MTKRTSNASESAKGRGPADRQQADPKNPTYQESLDEALDETFPASDPIAPTAAERADKPVSTDKDDEDWAVRPIRDTR